MNSFTQIDFIFFFLKERNLLSANFSKEYIWNHVARTKEIEINRQVFEEILQRLIDDGYIKEILNSGMQPSYHLTFNGRIFEGYSNMNESLNAERKSIKKLQLQTLENSTKLNTLTCIIAVGTIFSAFYYLIEILKFFYILQ